MPICEACSPGQYCAGGDAPAAPCGGGTWDDDVDPATACVPWATCIAGSYVEAPGDATRDRICQPCARGSYSDHADGSACTPFTGCRAGEVEQVGGSVTHDRVCVAGGWPQIFGSESWDGASAVAVSPDGHVYVVGALVGQASVGASGAYVHRFDR